ncbi:MAG: serine protease [Chloroflexota bacterium]
MASKNAVTKKQLEALRNLHQQEVELENQGQETAEASSMEGGAFESAGGTLEGFAQDKHERVSNIEARTEFIEAETPEFGELGGPGTGGEDETEAAGPGAAESALLTEPATIDEEFLLDAWHAEYSDAITRTILRQPDAVGGALEVLIGKDDREQITGKTNAYPWRCICSLKITANDGSNWIGTGWLVGPRTVLTAGHCVYIHKRGGWARSVEVIPGRDGTKRPFNSCVSKDLHSVRGWTENRERNYDYAAIILPDDCRYGDQLGWLGFANYDDATLSRFKINLSGYPGDKPTGTQWFHSRELKKISKPVLTYEIDTAGGQSGAPVWVLSKGLHFGVGIHTNGHVSGNSAVRINNRVYDNLVQWKNEGE